MEEAGRVLQVVAHQVDMVLEQDNRLLFNIQSLRVVDQHQIFAYPDLAVFSMPVQRGSESSCFLNADPDPAQKTL